ncbi:DUF6338 family protein [Kribbella sp. NPDC051770]|uniref:DUF6338 family protein n=1 Tax=Kribbella sp. NPDC051770 TaxID=3155413 RepID=UPI00342C041F
MIPDSAAALLALLGLVAPGLVYQARRERRRPPSVESAFREASRVALTSLLFTVAATTVMVVVASAWPALPEISTWLRDPGAYLPDNYAKVGLFLLLELVLACCLAILFEAGTGRGLRGNILAGSLWYGVLRRDVPAAATRVWLWIVTKDGTELKGGLRGYTPGESDDVQEISIGGSPIRRLRPKANPATGWETLDAWDSVVVSAAEIKYFLVVYLDAEGNLLRAEPKAAWWKRAGTSVRDYLGRRPSRIRASR